MAYVRNLVAAEEAVMRGQFNAAKILRASAHSQRTLAMNAARLLQPGPDATTLFEGIVAELQAGQASYGDIQPGPDEPALADRLEEAGTVRQHLLAILGKSIESLRDNNDVLESDVNIYMYGCHRCGNVMEGLREACEVCGALPTELEWFGPYYSHTPEHLGQLQPAEMARILEEMPDQLATAILSVDDPVLRRKPTPDEWSAKEIVGHMIETHDLFQEIAQTILTATELPDVSKPIPPWKTHEGKGYEEMPVTELVARFGRACSRSLALVQSLTPEQWQRRGVSYGRMRNLVDFGTWLTNHDPAHLAQIQRQCQAG
jgi:rubrerythrin